MTKHRPWEETAKLARAHGQECLLEHATRITDAGKRKVFMDQVGGLDFQLLSRLFHESQQPHGALDFSQVTQPPIIRLPKTDSDRRRDQEAKKLGEEALRHGAVAILLVAGGQGTRLGWDAPKGTFPIGPVTDRSLFQLHAEKILALSRRYGHPLPLLIMTSAENDEQTQAFFRKHEHFGLPPDQITFFVQGMLPALDAQSGEVLLKAEGQIAFSPNGHGGIVAALQAGGHLARLEQMGVKECFYFQVDNPLVQIADPVFLGHHLSGGADMSLKVLAKLYPQERLGNLVQIYDRMHIIEYTELPKALAEARTDDGELRIWAGSPAIHVFSLRFLQRLGTGEIELPYHVARKAVPHIDGQGRLVKPPQPNGLKFERFVFDALPLAERAVAVEASRAAEFEPLKNATGENSPQSVRQALSDHYAQWLEDAGANVSKTDDGHAAVALEISPLVAVQAEDLRGKIDPDLYIHSSWVLSEATRRPPA